MKIQKNQLTIPLTKISGRRNEFLEWLDDQEIEYQLVEVMRQATGFPDGWTCCGPALEFSNIGDVVAFKLRWM